MTSYFNPKISFILAAVLMLPVAQAATMSKADYKAGRTRISEEYKTERVACDSQAGNAKDVCNEEAKGKEKVALAELEYSYSGKLKDHKKILVAKAKLAYEVARKKCYDKSGNEENICVKEAKTSGATALVDINSGKQIQNVSKVPNQHKHVADHKVASEKCYLLAGDAKDSCITAAKIKYGIE